MENNIELSTSERIGDIWAFNPEQLGEKGLLETLVGREDLIEDICKWLRRSKGKVPKHHRLFFGTRGSGKTTLLLAVYWTILQEKDLKDSFLPVKFVEDSGTMPFENTFVKETYDSLKKITHRLGIEKEFLMNMRLNTRLLTIFFFIIFWTAPSYA